MRSQHFVLNFCSNIKKNHLNPLKLIFHIKSVETNTKIVVAYPK